MVEQNYKYVYESNIGMIFIIKKYNVKSQNWISCNNSLKIEESIWAVGNRVTNNQTQSITLFAQFSVTSPQIEFCNSI